LGSSGPIAVQVMPRGTVDPKPRQKKQKVGCKPRSSSRDEASVAPSKSLGDQGRSPCVSASRSPSKSSLLPRRQPIVYKVRIDHGVRGNGDRQRTPRVNRAIRLSSGRKLNLAPARLACRRNDTFLNRKLPAILKASFTRSHRHRLNPLCYPQFNCRSCSTREQPGLLAPCQGRRAAFPVRATPHAPGGSGGYP
jgi:hypothetical protein